VHLMTSLSENVARIVIFHDAILIADCGRGKDKEITHDWSDVRIVDAFAFGLEGEVVE